MELESAEFQFPVHYLVSCCCKQFDSSCSEVNGVRRSIWFVLWTGCELGLTQWHLFVSDFGSKTINATTNCYEPITGRSQTGK